MSKIAFLFPGQGAQCVGMGQDFYENSEVARNLYDAASEWLQMDMKELCFQENDRLDVTEFTQPALVTTELAMARTLMAQGIVPDLTAGLSLGEYAAIAVAGGMSDETAVKTVRRRGILMQEAVPAGGAMSAVLGLTGEAVADVVANIEGVTVANYNCPGQIVITGMEEAVAEAGEKLSASGAKRVVPLKVSGPFHSPFLIEAGKKLGEALAEAELMSLQIPYVTNVTAEYVTDIAETPALLEHQVAASVRWQQSIEKMLADGVDTFIEIGPGRTLAGFMKKIDKSAKVINVASYADIEKAVAALQEQGEQ